MLIPVSDFAHVYYLVNINFYIHLKAVAVVVLVGVVVKEKRHALCVEYLNTFF